MAAQKQSGVYVIRHVASGARYVGQAADIARRWESHRRDLRSGTAHSPKLQAAWAEHSEAAFAFEVLEECPAPLLDEREEFHMRQGCDLNHVQPLPALALKVPTDMMQQLSARLAELSPKQLAQYSAELDAEERAADEQERAEEAKANELEEFSSMLLARKPGDRLTAGEIAQAQTSIESGYPIVAYGAARCLEKSGQVDEAERLLLLACTEEERRAKRDSTGVAPACFERLAVMYAKAVRLDDEVAILQRYLRNPPAPGAGRAKLKARLDKARAMPRRPAAP